jgi:hypothetical protein
MNVCWTRMHILDQHSVSSSAVWHFKTATEISMQNERLLSKWQQNQHTRTLPVIPKGKFSRQHLSNVI